jgi:hypothetical protein
MQAPPSRRRASGCRRPKVIGLMAGMLQRAPIRSTPAAISEFSRVDQIEQTTHSSAKLKQISACNHSIRDLAQTNSNFSHLFPHSCQLLNLVDVSHGSSRRRTTPLDFGWFGQQRTCEHSVPRTWVIRSELPFSADSTLAA